MKNIPIGIFDSGLGGLSVLNDIIKLIPNQEYIYLADTANLPFGQKTEDQLKKITTDIVNFFIKNYNTKIIVIACNTATTITLNYLRQNFPDINFIGVVPVVKPACQLSKTGTVAILSTPVTANSAYQKNLIAQFAGKTKVLSIACPDLVDLIETNKINSSDMAIALKTYLSKAIENNADVIGLGCTHYIFLRNQIEKLIPQNSIILDSGQAVAKQTLKILQTLNSKDLDAKKLSIFVTKNPENFYNIGKELLPELVTDVKLIKI